MTNKIDAIYIGHLPDRQLPVLYAQTGTVVRVLARFVGEREMDVFDRLKMVATNPHVEWKENDR